MTLLAAAPVWLLACLIFLLRVADVTLGTVRTVSIVRGRLALSMVLGFFEVLIWITVIAQAIVRLNESWLLLVAYAGGFSAGNGVGIMIERRLALGAVVFRIISQRKGQAIAAALRAQGRTVTTFDGEGKDGPVTLVYAAGPRRDIRKILATAQEIDSGLFYVIEPAHESNRGDLTRLRPVPHPTGWRAIAKKK